jgi:hypothetical protein
LRISLSSIETCRFSISNIGVLIEQTVPPGGLVRAATGARSRS